MTARTRIRVGLLATAILAFGLPAIVTSEAVAATTTPVTAISPGALPLAQPVPGHTRLVPDTPRNNTPKINNGEIWDIAVIPQLNRVFIAGSFTSIQNNLPGNTTTVNQRYLASYNYQTGAIDQNFRPTFNGGVAAVEASPDGTKLFVGGSFNTVNGTAAQKVASLNLTTGAPIAAFGFTNSTNNAVTALEATNSTVYIGGRFSRVNGVLKSGLAAANATTGVVDASFANDISGGIGVDGALQVQQLKLTHDESKLLVLHTGRQIAGQDRLAVGIIDLSTKQLLPWRTQLWDTNLARLGGVTRVYSMDVAPNDQYFVIGSGSGGDAPPISDTAVAYPLTASALQSSDVQPLWITRNFDSVYSIAITETAVYIGGHFQFTESPTSCADKDPSVEPCYPGLENVGYGTGQGLAGYGLGDAVVRRDHIAALDPATGRALEWSPGSNSFEGNKAMEATARGLFVGGDGQIQGSLKTGRVAFYDFNTLPAASTTDTTITTPIMGRVIAAGTAFTVNGTATSPQGVRNVKVQIKDVATGRWLRTDGTWSTTSFAFTATLNTGTGANRTWTLPLNVTGNHPILASAWTTGTSGTTDSATKAVKKFETFSFDDQTPTTNITGPSGIQTSTSFTLTGTANDDHGVNRLSFWFRDENQNYLQPDGSVSPIFNTFSGQPDVVGATSATWSYDVTLPHEGVWRASATATDTAGQPDLRSATRDITVNSNAQAPVTTLSSPVDWAPPAPAPGTFTVTPGQPITFSGTATDDEAVQLVEITLRNSSTRENLGADGSWGVNVIAGNHRISPQSLNAPSYNWSYTTPFNLTPGSYSFTVRATDNDGLVTSSANQGRLSFTAQIPGDNPPDTTLSNAPVSPFTITNPAVSIAGTAADDLGVQSVQLTVVNNETGRYLQDDGTTYSSTYNTINASLSSPGAASTSWTYNMTVPGSGDYRVTAIAFDSAGQQDPSSTGATARYMYHPNDLPPGFDADLGQPVSGAAFTDGKIVVTGRALDDVSIANVQVGIVNAAGQYMSGSGTFTSTTPSFRTAFLNSPGSTGSNFSYTTPVIPDGTYQVIVQSVDSIGQISPQRISTGVTVTHPANNPPVASFTYSCNPNPDANMCTFDGRSSTDENPTALTYAWSFGTQGSATGPLPSKTFTAPGTFAVTLTVTDQWNVANTSAAQNVVISEPTDNVAPVPTFTTGCTGVTCAVSSTGTADPNTGDTIAYSWNWGDGTALSTGATPSAHTYATPGSYTITLTTTDGWGKAASTTRNISLVEPAGNQPPTAVFSVSCPSFTVCATNSAGTVDPDSDAVKYSWSFGEPTFAGATSTTNTSTSSNPSHTYDIAGTYTITLTATDVWGKFSTVSHNVTITEPGTNNAPTAVIASGTCATFTTCAMSATGSSDPDTATGDGIRNYLWSWGEAVPDTTGTSASQSHVYLIAGTYTVTLRVVDKWGHRSAPVTMSVTTQAEPAGNNPPTVVFPQPTCTARVCTMSTTGTADTDGGIRGYSWNFGEPASLTNTSTSTNPSHTYAAAGTFTITLVVTDNWGRSTTVTRSVTVA
jgi:large repetitive protein